MKHLVGFALLLLLSASLFGCGAKGNEVGPEENTAADHAEQGASADQGAPASENGVSGGDQAADEETAAEKENAVAELVEQFGQKLQNVSLLAPRDDLVASMQENYAPFVSDGLLAEWQNDPDNAPGRLVSSPWPDRIELEAIEETAENTYRIEGEIVEVTSVEQADGGAAAKRPITLEVRKLENRWLIDAVTLGDYDRADSTGNTPGSTGETS